MGNPVELFCDASWSLQHKVGGWGVHAKCKKRVFEQQGPTPDYCTDPTAAELSAIYMGVYHMQMQWNLKKTIIVHSDCKAALNLAQADNGHKREDLRKLQELLWNIEESNNLRLKFKWVRGHANTNYYSTYPHNRADGLSRGAMHMARDKILEKK